MAAEASPSRPKESKTDRTRDFLWRFFLFNDVFLMAYRHNDAPSDSATPPRRNTKRSREM